jgi:DNA repair exonuclease SbcCD ATPase subunit
MQKAQELASTNLKKAIESVKLAEYLYGVGSKEAATATAALKVAEEEATVATGGFKVALLETGIGAFVIAIGYIIEKLSSMNDEFQKSIDKTGQFKDAMDKTDEFKKKQADINLSMSNFGNLNQEQQIEAYKKAKEMAEEFENEGANKSTPLINQKKAEISELRKQYEAIKSSNTGGGDSEGVYESGTDVAGSDLKKKMDALTEQVSKLEGTTKYSTEAIKGNKQNLATIEAYFKTHKIDPNRTAGVGGKTNIGQDAINTSNLSGASGGLGQAKVINIHIDTMQKVTTNDNKELKTKGQDAVEVMVRAVNNLAYSQGGTM